MEISIYDKNTFDIHVDMKELLEIYYALNQAHGPDYYFMAQKIEETVEQFKP